MDIVLTILGVVFLLIGLLGCVLPVIPGPPFAYISLLFLHFTDKYHFSTNFLIIWGVIVLLVTLSDYFAPIVGAKRNGGSKLGIFCATVGMLVGLFFPPFGIILGPFIGAFWGEIVNGYNKSNALRAGWGVFIGVMTGTILKLIACGAIIFLFFHKLISG